MPLSVYKRQPRRGTARSAALLAGCALAAAAAGAVWPASASSLQEESVHLGIGQVKAALDGASLTLEPMRKYEIALADLGLGDRAQVQRIAGVVGVATVRHGLLRLMTTDSQPTGELELTQPGQRVVLRIRVPGADGPRAAESGKSGAHSIPLPPIPSQVVGHGHDLPPLPPVPLAPPPTADASAAPSQAQPKSPQ